jgi:hypothetical protein
LLHDVAIRADRIENTVPSSTSIDYVAWSGVTCSIVASLFIVPLPSNLPRLSANMSQHLKEINKLIENKLYEE